MTYGGGLVGSAMLAGCTGGGSEGVADEGSSGPSSNATSSSTSAESAESAESESEDPEQYAATMAPVGEVALDEPPESVVGGWGFAADVLTALGRGDAIAGMARPGFWYQGFYDLLPGVTGRDTTEIPATVSESYRVKEELLYEIDPDLLATDPNRFIAWYRLEPSMVETIDDDVAPFFGNESRSKRSSKWPNWPSEESYPYYGITEFVGRYGELFGEQERAEAMIDLYETTLDDVTSRVPPESERPTVGVLSAFTNPENRGFFGVNDPMPALDATHELKQYGDLGVVDAFEGRYTEGGHVGLKADFETLLEVDPDVLVFSEAVNALGGRNVYGNAGAYEQTLEVLRTDEVGEQLSAVRNDRLYPGGTGSQGPIVNLFQTEAAAKQFYPETFGEWNGIETLSDPSERLFDYQRVADAVRGDL
jgi:ABC-type Fe3+-hydroxamate transport system substrate-binding protein